MALLYIALGGAAGALGRYVLGGWIQTVAGGTFPWGTLLVNAVGSFALGCAVASWEVLAVSAEVRQAVAIGLLGGFTTFSTFSYETVALLQDGDWSRAVAYAAASVGLALAAVFAGLALGWFALQPRG